MPDLVEFVRHSVEVLGQVVYVAGLDGDFRREKFGGVLDSCRCATQLRARRVRKVRQRHLVNAWCGKMAMAS